MCLYTVCFFASDIEADFLLPGLIVTLTVHGLHTFPLYHECYIKLQGTLYSHFSHKPQHISCSTVFYQVQSSHGNASRQQNLEVEQNVQLSTEITKNLHFVHTNVIKTVTNTNGTHRVLNRLFGLTATYATSYVRFQLCFYFFSSLHVFIFSESSMTH